MCLRWDRLMMPCAQHACLSAESQTGTIIEVLCAGLPRWLLENLYSSCPPQVKGGSMMRGIHAALQHADCVLATEENVAAPDFPLDSFCCLIRYVHDAFAESSSRTMGILQQAPCQR